MFETSDIRPEERKRQEMEEAEMQKQYEGFRQMFDKFVIKENDLKFASQKKKKDSEVTPPHSPPTPSTAPS
jgi:hypothetical protein